MRDGMKDIALKNYDGKVSVLTRREIILQWQSGLFLDYYCCPNCRDLLFKFSDRNEYYCMNTGCRYYYGGEL